MEYTKGEWQIHNQDFRSGDELIIHPQCGENGIYPFYCKIGGTDKVANAHLIAAAPAMYEALKKLVPPIYAEACYQRDPDTIIRMNDLMIAINKALAKAEGK
jgi:hypothetical protein